MTLLARRGMLFSLAALAALPACGLLAPQPDAANVPPLDIPPLARQPPPASAKDARPAFPSLDRVRRDPFLTQAEQDALERPAPVVEPAVVVPKWHRRLPRSKPAPIRHMALEFQSWIGGGGKQRAIARDEKSGRTLQLWVGRKFGDWTVIKLTSSEIVLQYKDGRTTDTYKFQVPLKTSPWSSP